MLEKVMVFDVWGDYAHFRKNYSTSSPLTHSFPPRTAICGLMGAIAGLDKRDYFRHFLKDDAKIACRILAPIKKVRVGENLIDTKSAVKMHLIKNRTQIRFEFVKDPRYRIYCSHSDEGIYAKLKELISGHRTVYTPSLGLSQLICNFEYSGEYRLHKSEVDEIQTIESVVPGRCLLGSPDFEDGKEYFSEVMPTEMGEGREVKEYGEVLFERNGHAIRAKTKDLWELENGERILFL